MPILSYILSHFSLFFHPAILLTPVWAFAFLNLLFRIWSLQIFVPSQLSKRLQSSSVLHVGQIPCLLFPLASFQSPDSHHIIPLLASHVHSSIYSSFSQLFTKLLCNVGELHSLIFCFSTSTDLFHPLIHTFLLQLPPIPQTYPMCSPSNSCLIVPVHLLIFTDRINH